MRPAGSGYGNLQQKSRSPFQLGRMDYTSHIISHETHCRIGLIRFGRYWLTGACPSWIELQLRELSAACGPTRAAYNISNIHAAQPNHFKWRVRSQQGRSIVGRRFLHVLQGTHRHMAMENLPNNRSTVQHLLHNLPSYYRITCHLNGTRS